MKSLKYEGVVKLKIFWSLKRLEAGLNGFKIKRVHYGKFGLQIIREPPYFSDPNMPLPFTLNTGLPPPSAFFVFVLLLLRFPAAKARRRRPLPQAHHLLHLLSFFFLTETSLPRVFSPPFLLRSPTSHGGRRREQGKAPTFLVCIRLNFHFRVISHSFHSFSKFFSPYLRWWPISGEFFRPAILFPAWRTVRARPINFRRATWRPATMKAAVSDPET